MPLAGTKGPDPKHQLQAMFNRDKPFKRLFFTVELNCRDLSGQYHGGNLESLAFRKLEVFACAAAESKVCQAVWERRNMESMRLNFRSESFAAKGGVRQLPVWESATNLRDEPAQEAKGWRVLTPRVFRGCGLAYRGVDSRQGNGFFIPASPDRPLRSRCSRFCPTAQASRCFSWPGFRRNGPP